MKIPKHYREIYPVECCMHCRFCLSLCLSLYYGEGSDFSTNCQKHNFKMSSDPNILKNKVCDDFEVVIVERVWRLVE